MPFDWSVDGVALGLDGMASLVVAALVFWARPWRDQNVFLAFAVGAEGCINVLVAFAAFSTAPGQALALTIAWRSAAWLIPIGYLLFISTFNVPWIAWLRGRGARVALLVAIALIPLLGLAFRDLFTGPIATDRIGHFYPLPGPLLPVLFNVLGLVSLLALFVMISAVRRGVPGSAARARARTLLQAFAVRDGMWVVLGIGYEYLRFVRYGDAIYAFGIAGADLAYLSLLAYGMVRHEALGFRIRPVARRAARHGARAVDGSAVYRAALEVALVSNQLGRRDERMLARLRRNLGVSEHEHDRLVRDIREARIRFGSERRGRFRVEGELGRGGQGRVFLAEDMELGRKVVLKQPLVAGVGPERFLKEARAAARVRHPNVVTVHEILSSEQPPVLVLEYVPGGSLQERLDREGPLDPSDAARLGTDILAGLVALHDADLVHGDLKPANILMDADGSPKIADFGLAGKASEMPGGAGTPGFLAPEVARGGPPDARSDIWAVGAMLRSMVTLTSLTTADGLTQDTWTPEAALGAPTPDVGAGPLGAAIQRALAPDPGNRFQDARSMLRALSAAAPGAPPSTGVAT